MADLSVACQSDSLLFIGRAKFTIVLYVSIDTALPSMCKFVALLFLKKIPYARTLQTSPLYNKFQIWAAAWRSTTFTILLKLNIDLNAKIRWFEFKPNVGTPHTLNNKRD